ncbi:hypothetical protein [Legionella jamestowniensis]|uniref:Coiled-coil protein n=1 Tax=Legionella jamestowniensis TaxID=455 RepID=A0A0W0UHX9_9GAMM|nr:hypothetical protein [Legionella jamestowniensis]KTD07502.1 coiled-coil protein [Legionella jamestowniensis]SFM00974.1 hypothetical protein SAMN02746073_3026 [Legionella jamestowniensis DSM 19215]
MFNASLMPMEILKKLQEMHEMHLKGRPLPDKTIILLLLKKLPLFSNFFHGLDGTGASISKLVAIKGQAAATAAQAAGNGFQWAGLGLALIDFFRIPLIYLAALLIGQKPPITLNKNARWLYSTVLLVLTIISLTVPAAAPPIALVTAILGFGCSVFLLIKHVREYLQTQKTLREVEEAIQPKAKMFKQLQDRAKSLQEKIEREPENFEACAAEFVELEKAYNTLKEELQILYDKQVRFSQKLAKMNMMSLTDKTVAIGLSAMAVIGLAVTLTFPVVGLAVVAAAAALGSVYILARILVSPVIQWIKWISNKLNGKSGTPVTNDQKDIVSPSINLESTGLTMVKLHGQEAIHALEEQVALLQQQEQVEHKLQVASNSQNPKLLLRTIKEIICSSGLPLTLEELRGFLGRAPIQPTLQMLQSSISQIEMSAQEREQFLSHESLVTAFKETGIDLNQIIIKKTSESKHSPSLFQEENKSKPNLPQKMDELPSGHH